MKLIAVTKLSVILLLIAALFISAGCSKSNKSGQTEVANPDRSNKSTLEMPNFNNEAWRGQGRLAFTREDKLYVLNGDNGTITRLSDTGPAGKPQWSPGGEWLAYLGNGNRLVITKADGSITHEITGLPAPVNALDFAWSPNADALAVATGVDHGADKQEIYLAWPGETPRRITSADTSVSSFAWSPDGKTIAYVDTLPYDEQAPVNRDDALYITPVEGGKPLQLHIEENAGIILAGWRPDGNALLFWVDPGHGVSSCADGLKLYSLPLSGGKPYPLTVTQLYPEWRSWSPDGQKLLAVAGYGREFWMNKYLVEFDSQTGTCTKLPRQTNTVTLYPDWSPDGRYISYLEAAELEDYPENEEAITAWEQTWSLWIADAGGANARRLDEAGTGIERALWSRDGSHIIYLKDNAVWLINVHDGNPVKIVDVMPGQEDWHSYFAYTSPSYKLVYYR
ncbi:PD40 domain-containing protein [Desulfotruncus arcticus]|nr:PD40 domain-containing protein [Desulfotruncus arcticus]